MLELGIRGFLVVGLLTALACSTRGRGADRNAGRTGISELNVEADPTSDGDASSSGDPPIVVMGGDDSGYQAYQRWLATIDDMLVSFCSCLTSLNAFETFSECQSTNPPPTEEQCVASFSRVHPAGATDFFDCRIEAARDLGSCLNNYCLDTSDFDYCADQHDSDIAGCASLLTQTERTTLSNCANG